MRISIVALLAVGLCACAKSSGPNEGSQTHFLASCEVSCPAPYECLCGVCTLACESDASCVDHAEHAQCVAPVQAGEGCEMSTSLCDLDCRSDEDCAELGTANECSEGRCRESSMSAAGQGGAGGAGGASGVGGSGGMQSSADLGEICDGSTDMRLGYTSDGGFVDVSYEFTNPNGHAFVFVDGQCRYYASADYRQGIGTGMLDAGEMTDAIALAIHWDSIAEMAADEDTESCPDAGETSIWAPGYHASCSCGCNETAAGAKKSDALTFIYGLLSMLSQGGPLETPVGAVAIDRGPATGTEMPWPLDRPMTDIPGLVQDLYMNALDTPARFDSAADVATLRDFRDGVGPGSTLQVSDDGVAYDLFLRDELPEGVQDKIDALRETSAP